MGVRFEVRDWPRNFEDSRVRRAVSARAYASVHWGARPGRVGRVQAAVQVAVEEIRWSA